MNEARALFSTTDNESEFCTDGDTDNFMVMACEDSSGRRIVTAIGVVSDDVVTPTPVPEKQGGAGTQVSARHSCP